MCSNYTNHSKLNSEDDYGDPNDHLMSMRIFTMIVNKIFISALKMMRQMGKGHDFNLLINLRLMACSYPTRSGAERKVSIYADVYLSLIVGGIS